MKKTNFLYWTLFVCIGCSQSKYLAPSDNIQSSRYGSKITVYFRNNPFVQGELLATTDSCIYVLTEKKENFKQNILLQVIDKGSISRYTLQHSKSTTSSAAIFVLPLVALSHGLIATLTIPVNLLASSVLYGGSVSELQYTNNEIEWNNLYKFARFPQGLPPDVKLSDLLNRADPEANPINPVQYRE